MFNPKGIVTDFFFNHYGHTENQIKAKALHCIECPCSIFVQAPQPT